MIKQRSTIETLYKQFDQLTEKSHNQWVKEILTIQKGFPLISYRTRQTGQAIWILAGIHGDEPAGPMAISLSIDLLLKYGQHHPMIILPLCNPFGYYHEMRYPDGSNSVGDNEWLLREGQPRPSLPEAQVLSFYVLEQIKLYPPHTVIDLHEDMLSHQSYIYSYSRKDHLAQVALMALIEANFPPTSHGSTRFGEKIIDGIVHVAHDGSIDELFSTHQIIRSGQKIKGPHAKSVLVIETPGWAPLLDRVLAQMVVIETLLKVSTVT